MYDFECTWICKHIYIINLCVVLVLTTESNCAKITSTPSSSLN